MDHRITPFFHSDSHKSDVRNTFGGRTDSMHAVDGAVRIVAVMFVLCYQMLCNRSRIPLFYPV